MTASLDHLLCELEFQRAQARVLGCPSLMYHLKPIPLPPLDSTTLYSIPSLRSFLGGGLRGDRQKHIGRCVMSVTAVCSPDFSERVHL